MSAAGGSVESVGGVDQPSDDVLTHSSQYGAEEPAVTTGGTNMKQAVVVLLTLEGTLGTRTALSVAKPKVTMPGDKGVQAIVLGRIGIDDATVR